MKVTSGKSNSCAVDKYIGTGFDAVELVADNIDSIKILGPIINDLEDVVKNIDDLVRLANSLEEFQVTELFTLENLQTLITFNKLTTSAIEVFIQGQSVDASRLILNDDYIVESATAIRLNRTYPAGTKILGIQVVVADAASTVIYADKTVFNRDVFPLEKGLVLKDKEVWGMTLSPLIIFNYLQYYPLSPLPVEHVVLGEPVMIKNLELGHIDVWTDKGPITFCASDAMALPRVEIVELVRQALEDILSTPPRDWKPYQVIRSPSYQIMVNGLSYLPKKVPFTTASLWASDIDNWYLVTGREPKTIEVTSATLDLSDVDYAVILKADEPINVTNIRGNSRFRKILFIVENTNITLVGSDSLSMCSDILNLSPNCVHEFYTDHTDKLRQID